MLEKLYTEEEDQFVAIDPSNGQIKWNVNLGSTDQRISFPSIKDDMVYFVTLDDRVFAVDVTGNVKWITEIPDETADIFLEGTSYYATSSPTIASNGIILIPADRDTLALDSETGAIIWILPDGSGGVQIVVGPANDIYISGASFYAAYGLIPKYIQAQIFTAVEIQWQSQAGLSYQVEWTNDVDSGNWQGLGLPLIGTGAEMSVFDSTRSVPKRFYRVKEQ